MAKLIISLSLLGCLAGLSQGEQIAVQLALWLDGTGEPVASVPRSRPTGTSRATGFRTSHVRVPIAKPSRYDPLIEQYASRSEVNPALVRAVVQVESGFDPHARSSAGAMGLMQLMPATAAELGVVDPYNPSENIRGGVVYLKRLLELYRGNEELALAAYNAGPGAVARYGNRVPPYRETRHYVRRVRAAVKSVVRNRGRAEEGTVYKSYAIEDGWWTVVYSNVPPASGTYEATTEITPEDLATRTARATGGPKERG